MSSSFKIPEAGDSRPSDKIISLVLTAIIHGGILLLCLFFYLSWPPTDMDPMEMKEKEEILFGGEFVQLGNVANSAPVTRPTADEPMPSEMPKDADAYEAVDLTNEGTTGDPMPVVAAQQESPMKVKEQPRPEKAGPTAEEIAAAEKAKREKEARERIKNQMNFGQAAGSATPSGGSPTGGDSGGSTQGAAGHDLAGRTVSSWGANSSTKSGEIRITVKVNASGHVISATYAGGSGPVSADAAMRQKCIAASKASRFSVREGNDADQTGTITWRFK